ncbi:hypothetical protein BCT60_02270 [Vibrio breoganii]|nr:hypothetical protein BCU74_03245 [Vibrio breoganii]PMM12661.1 hypothetical protein BCT60_02270 [Vibrio breoganii]
MQRLFENKGANTKDRARMKQMIKRGLVYAIRAYIREISCQPQAASRKSQVVRVLGDDGLFGACF